MKSSELVHRCAGYLAEEFCRAILSHPNFECNGNAFPVGVNKHNGKIPRATWLLPWESDAIIAYRREHPEEGYRRLTYMMIDDNIVAVSPSSVYRVLTAAGLMARWNTPKPLKKRGFEQPDHAHEHQVCEFSRDVSVSHQRD